MNKRYIDSFLLVGFPYLQISFHSGSYSTAVGEVRSRHHQLHTPLYIFIPQLGFCWCCCHLYCKPVAEHDACLHVASETGHVCWCGDEEAWSVLAPVPCVLRLLVCLWFVQRCLAAISYDMNSRHLPLFPVRFAVAGGQGLWACDCWPSMDCNCEGAMIWVPSQSTWAWALLPRESSSFFLPEWQWLVGWLVGAVDCLGWAGAALDSSPTCMSVQS
jgi:hypothetical protein